MDFIDNSIIQHFSTQNAKEAYYKPYYLNYKGTYVVKCNINSFHAVKVNSDIFLYLFEHRVQLRHYNDKKMLQIFIDFSIFNIGIPCFS